MNTSVRFPRILTWAFLPTALVACGFAVAERTEAGTDPVQEIHERFSGFEGLARQIPMEEWDGYFLDTPFSIAVRDGEIQIGKDRFHRRVEEFLRSPESEELSFDFDLKKVWSIAGRVALVRGEIEAKVGPDGPVRPFTELLVKSGGRWRTIFSHVQSASNEFEWDDGGRDTPGRAACSCEPCRHCSRER